MLSSSLSKSVTMVMRAIFIFALLMTPLKGAAQSGTQKSIISQLLWQSLLQCYSAPKEFIAMDDLVILHVELSTSGDFVDLPNIVTPAQFSKGERALLREATSALIMCAPFISDDGDKAIYGAFQIVVNQDGLSLTKVNAEVGSPDVVPTFEAVVNEEVPAEVSETEEPETANIDAATPEDEKTLELTSSDRRELQRRLVLLGYNTRGVDGVFGPGSRNAIQDWQTNNAVPPSGYFDANQIAVFREMSDVKYAAWVNRPRRYTDRNGCLREASGKIVEGRSFKCDLNAAGQSLGISR